MLIVPPHKVEILDNNIPDNPEPAWDSDTTYSKGDKVQYNNYVYESLTDDNKGNNPEESLDWYKDKPINRWACFDGFTDTKTENDDDNIYYKFKTSDVDKIAFFNLEALEIYLKLTDKDSDKVVYEKTIDLQEYDIQDWWDWTYKAPSYRKDVYTSIPMVYNGELEVTIKKADDLESCKIGAIVYGQSEDVGISVYGVKVSRRTVVKKERDPDGRIRVKKGITYKRTTIPVKILNNYIDLTLRRFDAINGTPTLFIGDERDEKAYESLVVYGIFKDFDISIKNPVINGYDLEIEGVG